MSLRHKPPSLTDPPGGILIWLIVVLELLTFAAGLIVFTVQEKGEPAVFAAGRATLSQPLSLTNTLVLLTGGWFMVNALTALRRDARPVARRWTAAAILTGLTFLTLKSWEYSGKLQHGLDLRHDSFFTLYWLLTGFHFMHVAVAVIILTVFWFSLRRGTGSAEETENFEAGGIFWHLCDLIWLLLYPILYLLP